MFDSGIPEDEHKDFTLRDTKTGEKLQVEWCIDGAYFIIYNYAPMEQTFRVSFKTGYRMDHFLPHSMCFFTGEKAYCVTFDESADTVTCDLIIHFGEKHVNFFICGQRSQQQINIVMI